MITRPRGVHHTKCAKQVVTAKYHPPRVTIAPNTRSLKVTLMRGTSAWSTQTDLIIDLVDKEGNKLHSYAVSDGVAYFNLATTTLFAEKGLHKARLFYGESCIGYIEIVRAPPFSALEASTTESECADSPWCEPENNASSCEDRECKDPCELEGCQTCDTAPCETLVDECATRHNRRAQRKIMGNGYV